MNKRIIKVAHIVAVGICMLVAVVIARQPTRLDAKHQAVMTKMSALSGVAFDRAYARQMIKDHNKDVALFQREADRGTDSDLKAFAQ
jgi:predicted outer membrane protein